MCAYCAAQVCALVEDRPRAPLRLRIIRLGKVIFARHSTGVSSDRYFFWFVVLGAKFLVAAPHAALGMAPEVKPPHLVERR